MRKVISTKARKKRKKAPQVSACPECGDFHYRKSDICKVRELKVKMIVQQIMNQSVNIKVSKFVNVTKNLRSCYSMAEMIRLWVEQLFRLAIFL